MPANADRIIALATPPGSGAIALFRLSGRGVIEEVDKYFKPRKGSGLTGTPSHRLRFGEMIDGEEVIDEVLVSVFRAPHSYTGEDMVEISCHASPYVQERILKLFLAVGFRLARPGEFSMRAFLNGKMDLTRAEAVADLIAAENRLQHRAAMHQLRGGFVRDIKRLRDRLVEFTALMELELDFAEEDVEFANREDLKKALNEIRAQIRELTDSFAEGNVIKHGVAVSIVGAPNTGKSTLLNALLNEEKAIVTDIPGTTRDAIEDSVHIDGIRFRFIDTAGIRHTHDRVERLGIERTFGKIGEARIVLWMIDAQKAGEQIPEMKAHLDDIRRKHPGKPVFVLLNKIDLVRPGQVEELTGKLRALKADEVIPLSAKQKTGIDRLKQALTAHFRSQRLDQGQTVITNVRHYQALRSALQALDEVEAGLQAGLSSDLIAVDLRDVLNRLGEITGEITTDDLLTHIFQNFCIGK